ncbi:H(+)-transporting two-sector ATPase [Desulfamplus magnetovallimortis]|uniref:H(+)-transporting two-sector ATPase n=1 Tax=Desulfamplus magnetovallimortis TaxID=1246637 RepID=A0A1W1HJC3_9BACT|nr:TrkH family potassium uptake protein [Desulfamplus magnetovallimortis]SLM32617.1 H(+)-transporting two-sector ATPase [Desulfamplus magnetovallimortis]
MNLRRRLLKLHPAALVLSSFMAAIFLGMFLLKLPVSVKTGMLSWMDALFTSTSAVCVTGLVVVDTGTTYSLFGQIVILFLIQIGGLGVMTLSVILFRVIGKRISFHQLMAVQDTFLHTPQEDIFKLVKHIFVITFFIELAGTVLLTIHWYGEFSLSKALYTALFHSISAFCNAGFSLFPDSLVTWNGTLLLNMTICTLIVCGGIGFSVLYEFKNWIKLRKKKIFRFTVHLKTVLLTTAILILLGAVSFYFLEQKGVLAGKPLNQKILISLFQSITCRTAGFNTVDLSILNDATLALMIFFMFFGASPGSCGGGVKTTTLSLLIATTVARMKRMKRVNMFKKSIPQETVDRSATLVLMSVAVISMVLFFILVGNTALAAPEKEAFLSYLFEVVSAFGTVGLSLGITPDLTSWGKFWIILTMIIGRVGILTFSYIIVGTHPDNGFERAEENMMIG